MLSEPSLLTQDLGVVDIHIGDLISTDRTKSGIASDSLVAIVQNGSLEILDRVTKSLGDSNPATSAAIVDILYRSLSTGRPDVASRLCNSLGDGTTQIRDGVEAAMALWVSLEESDGFTALLKSPGCPAEGLRGGALSRLGQRRAARVQPSSPRDLLWEECRLDLEWQWNSKCGIGALDKFVGGEVFADAWVRRVGGMAIAVSQDDPAAFIGSFLGGLINQENGKKCLLACEEILHQQAHNPPVRDRLERLQKCCDDDELFVFLFATSSKNLGVGATQTTVVDIQSLCSNLRWQVDKNPLSVWIGLSAWDDFRADPIRNTRKSIMAIWSLLDGQRNNTDVLSQYREAFRNRPDQLFYAAKSVFKGGDGDAAVKRALEVIQKKTDPDHHKPIDYK